MSEPDKQREERRVPTASSRNEKLREIEALYRSQIKQIYSGSKEKIEKEEPKKAEERPRLEKKSVITTLLPPETPSEKTIQPVRSATTLNIESGSKYLGEPDSRASTLLRGESTRTIEILRKENETKELKIRELSNKCEALVEKLKKHLPAEEVQGELESLREFSEGKMERLENLFKIKNEEIFFKIKLQIIALLQEFGVAKEQLSEINEVASEGALFSFMAKKLKGRLKDFRSKEQESNFVLQKDRILSEKQEERIHYLTETNELLKLAESKLKAKVEDLKAQLNDFIERLRQREQENEERESELFRLRRQNEELNSVNQKLGLAVKGANSEKVDERRVWEAKEKEMKLLLNNYFLEKKKLEGELEEQQGAYEEVLIKQKFLEQENERLNRELIRWKERYEWQEREKENRVKELEEEKNALLASFEDYKVDHNQGVLMTHRADVDEALRKVEEYQRAYQQVLVELDDERRLLQRAEEQAQEQLERSEREWLEKVKRLEKLKLEEMYETQQENEQRLIDLREQYEQKEGLLAEEMQARMKALLAEKDKKNTENTMALENQNDELRREIDNLLKILDVKESLINVINSKKTNYD